ncbi:MAG TPA: quinone-dependent dihydroorotate dehydrogenase [Candidatus Magasanikbacteria bacterium]|nr:quinone-dependent dihydroorotate dehydrogenase [Candidatus Magasanikbacteria bacterium]
MRDIKFGYYGQKRMGRLYYGYLKKSTMNVPDFFFRFRDALNAFLYTKILKNIFFMIDPETVHETMTRVGVFLGAHAITRGVTACFFYYSNKKLNQTIRGIFFSNPIGLAAGFDKDAQLTDILPALGFGFAEAGSITGEACVGNPRPRLWRLKKSKGLMIHYGLKNEGCERIAERLRDKHFQIPMGMSIAKTNCQKTVDLQAGIDDYFKAFTALKDLGNYCTINISCPNAFGGQPFTDPVSLDLLLAKIDTAQTSKPIFLKLSPDLKKEEIDAIIEVTKRHKIFGFICSNLTKNRDNKKIIDSTVSEKGGMSGKVVEDLSNELIRYCYQKTKGAYVIIGCGGVFSAEDAYKKIKAGASLVQMITGMIFEGPQVISQINRGLVALLEKDGFENIAEAIGGDYESPRRTSGRLRENSTEFSCASMVLGWCFTPQLTPEL